MKTIYSTSDRNINICLSDFNIIISYDININNIDLIIFNEHYDNSLYMMAKSLQIPCYGNDRFDKLQQYFILHKILNINCPKTYYNIQTGKNINTVDELNAFVDIDKFIVKPISGARGIGIEYITRDEWKKCMFDSKNIPNVFKNEFINDPDTNKLISRDCDVDINYIKDSFRSGNFIIQDKIDVMREFRLLLFRNSEYLCYERIKQSSDVLCSNMTHGSKPKPVIKNSDDDINIIYPMINDLYKIFDITNYPWVSIDLYVDSNNKTGVFEFQMEFAYEGFDYKDVKYNMTENLKYLTK